MDKVKKTSPMIGILLILLSISIVGVSAYVYQQATQTITQTIVEVATITLQNSALGNINEGQTITYTEVGGGGDVEIAELGDAITIATTTANVYLHLDSDLDSLTDYSSYFVVVVFDTVPGGSSHTSGTTACNLTMASPDFSSIDLDVVGTWTFDFDVTTKAGSVNADIGTTVTIIVRAESTA